MSDFCSHASVFRPWNRTIARSSAVAAETGGMLESNPCGMSTHTYGRFRSDRNESVSSTLRSSIHVLCRNSTATRKSGRRATHSSM